MDISLLKELNWLAVIVAGIAYWVIGALWYSPVMFEKPWQRMSNLGEDQKKGMGMAMMMSLVGFIIISAVMALLIYRIGRFEMMTGIKMGLLCGVGFSLITLWIDSLYATKPFKLVLINGMYHVVSLVVVGIILVCWT